MSLGALLADSVSGAADIAKASPDGRDVQCRDTGRQKIARRAMPYEVQDGQQQVQGVYQLARLLACAHLRRLLRERLDGLDWLEVAPAMVRACSSSRRQSRSRRSDCVVIVSCASHAGLLTGLACRAEHALALPKLPSHVYTCTPAGGAWTVCTAPSARQASKLNKGSPLPRQRTPSLLSRHDDLTCSVFLDDDNDDLQR